MGRGEGNCEQGRREKGGFAMVYGYPKKTKGPVPVFLVGLDRVIDRYGNFQDLDGLFYSFFNLGS